MLCRPHNKGPRPLRLSLSAPWASGATGPQPGHWGEQKGGPRLPSREGPDSLWPPLGAPGRLEKWESVCGRGLGGDLRDPALGPGQGLSTWRTGPEWARLPPEPRLLNPRPPSNRDSLGRAHNCAGGARLVSRGAYRAARPPGLLYLASGQLPGAGEERQPSETKSSVFPAGPGGPHAESSPVGKPKGARGVGVGDRRSPTGGLQTRCLATRPGPCGRLELSPAGSWAGRPSELSGVTVPGPGLPCRSAPGVAGSCRAGGDPRLG